MGKIIRTVLGDIKPEELGFTLIHEHIAAKAAIPVDGEYKAFIRNAESIVPELELSKKAGVCTIVDGATENFVRLAGECKKASEMSGVNIVATTGYMPLSWNNKEVPVGEKHDISNWTVEQLYNKMRDGYDNGLDGTECRPGHLKWGTGHNEISDFERRTLKAIAKLQKETGLSVFTHNDQGTMAIEQARLFLEEGVDPHRVCIGHMDIPCCVDAMELVASKGFYVAFDHVGRDLDTHDAKRIHMMKYLINRGYLNQILISGDMGKSKYIKTAGGKPGMDYIPTLLVQYMLEAGLTQEAIDTIFLKNTAEFLAFEG